MKWIHIIAGLLALVSGAMALYATKGSPWHRKSGLVFVFAMLVMSGTGALIAAFLNPNMINVTAGLLTFYLVCTALLTVRRTVEQSRGPLTGLMLSALALGALALSLGLDARANPRGVIDGIPAAPLYMFAVVGIAGGLLDARLLLAGKIEGAHRLARHVWRMGFAMFIATASFFLGQAKLFPEPIRKSGLLAIPVLVVIGVLLYWLVRLLLKRTPTPRLQPVP